jgi:energy-coupling factor transporter ATP-binding protein EcfA2
MIWLKELKVKHTRGIVNSDVPLNRNGLVIWGSNGTGKSSFVDALEFALTKSGGSLEKRGTGINWTRHGAHIPVTTPDDAKEGAKAPRTKKPAIELVLDVDGTAITVKSGKLDDPELPESVRVYLAAASNFPFVLRRRQLLDFLDATPADRYKQFRRLVNAEAFTAFVTSLSALLKRERDQQASAVDAINRAESGLRRVLAMPVDAPTDDAAVGAALATALKGSGIAVPDLDQAEAVLLVAQRAAQDAHHRTLTDLRAALDRMPTGQEIVAALTEVGTAHHACLAEEMRLTGPYFAGVLEDGRSWITAAPNDGCPLCRSSIDTPQVLSQIDSRLEERRALATLQRERTAAIGRAQAILTRYGDDLTQIRELGVIEGFAMADVESLIAASVQMRETLASADGLTEGLLSASMFTRLGDLGALRADVDARREAQGRNDGSDQEIRVNALRLIRDVTDFRTARQSAHARWAAHQPVMQHLGTLLECAQRAERTVIERSLQAVQAQAQEYFETIHPGEPIGGLTVSLKGEDKSALEVKGDFYGQSDDPRGYFSEGHADSAALCFFLALRRRGFQETPAFNLLVLDDVMHSVDEAHRTRLLRLLFDRFADHQLFITTHDEGWRDAMRDLAKREDRILERRSIVDWDIVVGPVFATDDMDDGEWILSGQVRSAGAQEVGRRAGLALEALMQQLCARLKVPVPYDPNNRQTLYPLWTNFQSSAKKRKSFAQAAESAGHLLDKVDEFGMEVRNQSSHPGYTVKIDHARQLVEAFEGLYRITRCNPDQRDRRSCVIERRNSRWICECGTLVYE